MGGVISEDVVVIGSSPIMLCQAIRLSRHGRQVTILDSASDIGGAWSIGSMLGYDDVEEAVHLLENRSQTHSILRDDMGVPLTAETEASGLLGSRSTSLRLARMLSFVGSAARALGRRDLPRAIRGARSSFQALRHWSVPFVYPPNGARQILDSLRQTCDQEAINLDFGRTIRRLEIDRGLKTVRAVCDDSTRVFRTAVISSRAHAEIHMDGVEVERRLDVGLTRSLVLHCEADSADAVPGYVEVLGDSILRRVRNIGRFATPNPPAGRVLLCVQIRERNRELPRSNPRLTTERVMRRLIDVDLLPSSCRLLAFEPREYENSTIPAFRLRRIGDLDRDRLLVVESTDFSEGLAAPLFRSGTGDPTLHSPIVEESRRQETDHGPDSSNGR